MWNQSRSKTAKGLNLFEFMQIHGRISTIISTTKHISGLWGIRSHIPHSPGLDWIDLIRNSRYVWRLTITRFWTVLLCIWANLYIFNDCQKYSCNFSDLVEICRHFAVNHEFHIEMLNYLRFSCENPWFSRKCIFWSYPAWKQVELQISDKIS